MKKLICPNCEEIFDEDECYDPDLDKANCHTCGTELVEMEGKFTFDAMKDIADKLKMPDQKALLFIPDGSEVKMLEVDPTLAKAYMIWRSGTIGEELFPKVRMYPSVVPSPLEGIIKIKDQKMFEDYMNGYYNTTEDEKDNL